MNSCLYEGWVRHRRTQDVDHEFRYRLFMAYLDLAELPDVFDGRWLWSARRPALARFDRRDFLGDPERPLDEAVRDLVEERTGVRPTGAIRLLTHLRYLGHIFNPVSFYYCYEGEELRFIVADITNTPWKEKHAYVLDARESRRFRFAKDFHVSPFLDMDYQYDWRFTEPKHRLVVHMENHRGGKQFDATLTLTRRAMTGRNMARTLLRYPAMTLKVVFGIYWQAFRLWRKRCPFHAHPAKRPQEIST